MQINPLDLYDNLLQWISWRFNNPTSLRNTIIGIRKQLKSQFLLKVYTAQNLELESMDFTIAGLYEPSNDEDQRPAIVITIIVNHIDNSPWQLSLIQQQRLCIEIVETIVHELRHQHQYRSRVWELDYNNKAYGYEISHDQKYLGQTDEIDAYAANIATRYWITKSRNIDELYSSYDLLHYYAAFGKDHPVVKRLLKKIVKNLAYLQENDRTLK